MNESQLKLECLKLAIQLHPRGDEDKILKSAESAYIIINKQWPTEVESPSLV